MKLLFLFNYNASGNTTRYCGVRFYHSRKAVTHLLHVTQTQGDRNLELLMMILAVQQLFLMEVEIL